MPVSFSENGIDYDLTKRLLLTHTHTHTHTHMHIHVNFGYGFAYNISTPGKRNILKKKKKKTLFLHCCFSLFLFLHYFVNINKGYMFRPPILIPEAYCEAENKSYMNTDRL